MGTGSNSTETAVKMTKLAKKEDVDAVLSVVPYYNKPSQKGCLNIFQQWLKVQIFLLFYTIFRRAQG